VLLLGGHPLPGHIPFTALPKHLTESNTETETGTALKDQGRHIIIAASSCCIAKPSIYTLSGPIIGQSDMPML
jgi:hypothetical protein